jgi:mannose-6-phosphate isomerase-like protein (cupin superfamily)
MDKDSAQILKAALGEELDSCHADNRKQQPSLPVDHWPSAVLLERAKYLRELARNGDGVAGETLREYPQHYAALTFRSRSGEAEVHDNFADMFLILAGTTILVTGGKVVGARQIGPGETRGDSIEGGTRLQLRTGDIAHVPAGTPHQMLIEGTNTVTYFVRKNQESE